MYHKANKPTKIMGKTQKKKKTNQNKTRKRRVFTKKDFVSGDGMIVSAWGPALWHSMHMISFNYPIQPTNKDKKYYSKFIKNLVHLLPCKYCRENLKKNLKKMPITDETMKNRANFSKYVYELHELVNKNLGKKSGLTYCDVRERYEHFRARCTINMPTDANKDKDKNKTLKRGKNKKENGCTQSLYGKNAKCIIKIVPKDTKCKTFQMDEECKKRKIYD